MDTFSALFLSTFGWFEHSRIGLFVRVTPYVYPVLMSLHVLGLAAMLGPAFLVDLRLLGLGRKTISVTAVMRLLLPVSHVGFVVVALTGGAMFTGIVYVLANSAAMPWKFGLILFAGLNILVFHKGIYRSVPSWDTATATPVAAKVAAIISMICWTGVIFGGRFLSY